MTRRATSVNLGLVLSREHGPPVHEEQLHEAILAMMMRGSVRVGEHTVYQITSIEDKGREDG